MSSSDESDKIVQMKSAKKRKLDKTKASKKNHDEKQDDDCDGMISLGNMKYASVSDFKGKLFVNIREYYRDGSGALKPGKKGICLKPQQWEKLKENMDQLDEMIQEKS